MKRREFVQKSASALGLLAAMQGGHSLIEAAEPTGATSEWNEARKQILDEMESGRRRSGLSVPREDGRFLNLLVHMLQAKNVLELGTFIGYSAIHMGAALEVTDGQLTTIEIERERVLEARENFKSAGLDNRITCIEGDAHQVTRELDGKFDLIFMDAEKGNEVDYFKVLFPKLNNGGVIALHNAIRFKGAMQPYLDIVFNHDQLISVILSLTMDDGFAVTYKK